MTKIQVERWRLYSSGYTACTEVLDKPMLGNVQLTTPSWKHHWFGSVELLMSWSESPNFSGVLLVNPSQVIHSPKLGWHFCKMALITLQIKMLKYLYLKHFCQSNKIKWVTLSSKQHSCLELGVSLDKNILREEQLKDPAYVDTLCWVRQGHRPDLKFLWGNFESMVFQDGLLKKKVDTLLDGSSLVTVYVPATLRREGIWQCQDASIAGHWKL